VPSFFYIPSFSHTAFVLLNTTYLEIAPNFTYISDEKTDPSRWAACSISDVAKF
jgi:hypothetical protein